MFLLRRRVGERGKRSEGLTNRLTPCSFSISSDRGCGNGDLQEQLLVHAGYRLWRLHSPKLQRPQHQKARQHRHRLRQAHRRDLPEAEEEGRRLVEGRPS